MTNLFHLAISLCHNFEQFTVLSTSCIEKWAEELKSLCIVSKKSKLNSFSVKSIWSDVWSQVARCLHHVLPAISSVTKWLRNSISLSKQKKTLISPWCTHTHQAHFNLFVETSIEKFSQSKAFWKDQNVIVLFFALRGFSHTSPLPFIARKAIGYCGAVW